VGVSGAMNISPSPGVKTGLAEHDANRVLTSKPVDRVVCKKH